MTSGRKRARLQCETEAYQFKFCDGSKMAPEQC